MRRWRVLLTVLTAPCTAFGLVALTGGTVPVVLPGSPSAAAAPATGGADQTALPLHPVPFGLFLGSDESDSAEAKLSQWLGGAPIQVGHTYLPGNNWDDIEGSPTLLGAWAVWKAEQTQRLLVMLCFFPASLLLVQIAEVVQIVEMTGVVALELIAGAGPVQLAQGVFDVLVGIAEDEVAGVLQHLALPGMLEVVETLQHSCLM